MCTVPLLKRFCRESYNEPEEVYWKLKRLGMDLVTVTDHDSMDAAENLRRYPDFFPSEEVTCQMPSGTEAHVGVYNIQERQHLEIQRRRTDLPSLLAYLSEQDILFSLNHPFSALTGCREEGDWLWFQSAFTILEVRNGHMLPWINSLALELARHGARGQFGGSDAHTMRSLGSAFTEVPGARNREEFLQGLRTNSARIHGENGGFWKLTRDLLSIGFKMIAEKPLTAFLLPLVSVIPLVVLGIYLNELNFAHRWSHCAGSDDLRGSASTKPLGSEGFA
jgi:predicted metal-dependent phosphoesterase TrpH